jgi:hypothetical protein
MESNVLTYKGFTIKTVGISRYIYRPGQYDSGAEKVWRANNPVAGYAQSMEAAKRWINAQIAKG